MLASGRCRLAPHGWVYFRLFVVLVVAADKINALSQNCSAVRKYVSCHSYGT